MTPEEFKAFGAAALEYVADYLTTECRKVNTLPDVEVGYLNKLIPSQVPEDPEDWKDVMEDFKTKIVPGILHWNSPNSHGYYPSTTSFGSVVGEILSGGLGVISSDWATSPAATELEVIVTDWLANFLNLPNKFHSQKGNGGGIIQGSAGESMLVAVLTAREQTVRRLVADGANEAYVRAHLIMYTSDECNYCVEKNPKLAGLKYRRLQSDEEGCLKGSVLEEAVVSDLLQGNIPCMCIATMGTTGTCDFDAVDELADVCKRFKMYIHVDAAFAGSAFCLPEYSFYAKKLENVDSLNCNLYKLMQINYECTAMWVANTKLLEDALNTNDFPRSDENNKWSPEYTNWQVPVIRRFRALKVWISLRMYGADKLKERINNRFQLAKYFIKLVNADKRFQFVKARFNVVAFRCVAGDDVTLKLVDSVTESRKLFILAYPFKNQIIIKFIICGMDPTKEDIDFGFKEIQAHYKKVCKEKI